MLQTLFDHFAFDSATQLLAMDGHGAYVWAAYGISAATLLALVVKSRTLRAQRLREIKILAGSAH